MRITIASSNTCQTCLSLSSSRLHSCNCLPRLSRSWNETNIFILIDTAPPQAVNHWDCCLSLRHGVVSSPRRVIGKNTHWIVTNCSTLLAFLRFRYRQVSGLVCWVTGSPTVDVSVSGDALIFSLVVCGILGSRVYKVTPTMPFDNSFAHTEHSQTVTRYTDSRLTIHTASQHTQ